MALNPDPGGVMIIEDEVEFTPVLPGSNTLRMGDGEFEMVEAEEVDDDDDEGRVKRY